MLFCFPKLPDIPSNVDQVGGAARRENRARGDLCLKRRLPMLLGRGSDEILRIGETIE